MFLGYTDEQLALRKELREYFAEVLGPPEARAQLGHPGAGNPRFREVIRRLGADGWLGLGWPKEYGGQGRDAIDQFILFDEVQRAGAPFPFVTVNTVGPTLMAFGTEEQKQRYLPAIARAEAFFSIGMSEPDSGSDLASVRTRAIGRRAWRKRRSAVATLSSGFKNKGGYMASSSTTTPRRLNR